MIICWARQKPVTGSCLLARPATPPRASRAPAFDSCLFISQALKTTEFSVVFNGGRERSRTSTSCDTCSPACRQAGKTKCTPYYVGAGKRTRTSIVLRPSAPKADASTNFAIPAPTNTGQITNPPRTERSSGAGVSPLAHINSFYFLSHIPDTISFQNHRVSVA